MYRLRAHSQGNDPPGRNNCVHPHPDLLWSLLDTRLHGFSHLHAHLRHCHFHPLHVQLAPPDHFHPLGVDGFHEGSHRGCCFPHHVPYRSHRTQRWSWHRSCGDWNADRNPFWLRCLHHLTNPQEITCSSSHWSLRWGVKTRHSLASTS